MTNDTEIPNDELSEDDDLNDAFSRWYDEDDNSYQSGAEDGDSWARSASLQQLINLARYVKERGYPECLRDLFKAIGNGEDIYFTAEHDNPEYVEGFVTATLEVYRKWKEYKSKK